MEQGKRAKGAVAVLVGVLGVELAVCVAAFVAGDGGKAEEPDMWTPNCIEAIEAAVPAAMEVSLGEVGAGAVVSVQVPEPEPEPEPEAYEEYWEPVYYYEYVPPYDASDGISPSEFRFLGVIEGGGTTYTWYSQNVLPGAGLTELNQNGRNVGEGGFVYDGDGYIAVASSDHEMGTVLETPFGEAKVYDNGCAEGVVDVYTAW